MKIRVALCCGIAVACGTGAAGRLVADPGPDRTVPAGTPVEFDGSGSRGQITSYDWNFGDGSERQQGAKVAHTFASEGDFQVSLTVRGPGGADTKAVLVHVGKGCVAKAVVSVGTVDSQPGVPVAFDGSASTGCADSTVISYRWEFGDGVVEEGDASKARVNHTYAAQGTYQVLLRITDARGTSGSATRTVNVGITAGKPAAICPGPVSTVTGRLTSFTGSANIPGGGTIATYTWTFSDDNTTETTNPATHKFMRTGTFTVSLVVATQDGRKSDPCSPATTVTVTAPIDYSGNWGPLNPTTPTMGGDCSFAVGFPATALVLTQTGMNMSAAPSGNGWPAGVTLSGAQEPAPAETFLLGASGSAESKPGCSGTVTPRHTVSLTFTSPTRLTGSWRIGYSFLGDPLCNCSATATFYGIKQ